MGWVPGTGYPRLRGPDGRAEDVGAGARQRDVITIRLQTPDDLEVAEEVGHSALGPSQTIGDTYRIAQRAQPDGSFLAVEDGEAVGTATIVDYGPFCYIGAMCVRAERQRQGIGRALLERVLAWREEKATASGSG